jgi:ketosteroid isomerase-like protein
MSHEAFEIFRLASEAFDRGDRGTVARVLAPDVEWHWLGGLLLGVGTIRGREAMLKFLWEGIREALDGFRVSPEEFTVLGSHRPGRGGCSRGAAERATWRSTWEEALAAGSRR